MNAFSHLESNSTRVMSDFVWVAELSNFRPLLALQYLVKIDNLRITKSESSNHSEFFSLLIDDA